MNDKPSNKKKVKHSFSSEDAVAYLRHLADQLEGGTLLISGQEAKFEGLVKVKEALKLKDGKTSVKVSFKLTTEPEPPTIKPGEAAEEPVPLEPEATEPASAEQTPSETDDGSDDESEQASTSYKKLKKLMDKQMKEIAKDLEAGGISDPTLVEDFCSSCLAMTTFTGEKMGEAGYPQFQAQAQALLQAAKDQDDAALRQAFDDLKAAKKACHKEYK